MTHNKQKNKKTGIFIEAKKCNPFKGKLLIFLCTLYILCINKKNEKKEIKNKINNNIYFYKIKQCLI